MAELSVRGHCEPEHDEVHDEHGVGEAAQHVEPAPAQQTAETRCNKQLINIIINNNKSENSILCNYWIKEGFKARAIDWSPISTYLLESRILGILVVWDLELLNDLF